MGLNTFKKIVTTCHLLVLTKIVSHTQTLQHAQSADGFVLQQTVQER